MSFTSRNRQNAFETFNYKLSTVTTCETQNSLRQFTTLKVLGGTYKSRSSSTYAIAYPKWLPLVFLILNIFLKTSLPNTCNLCYFFKIRDHVSHRRWLSCGMYRRADW